jgi:hypothetical protein
VTTVGWAQQTHLDRERTEKRKKQGAKRGRMSKVPGVTSFDGIPPDGATWSNDGQNGTVVGRLPSRGGICVVFVRFGLRALSSRACRRLARLLPASGGLAGISVVPCPPPTTPLLPSTHRSMPRQPVLALNSLKYLRYRHLFKALYTKILFSVLRRSPLPLRVPSFGGIPPDGGTPYSDRRSPLHPSLHTPARSHNVK